MPISVHLIVPVLAAPDAAVAELVLKPGTVVDARVLQLLADNLVRIAIANISIDVLSQVPLQPGQTLQLAVAQNDSGFRLTLLGQAGGPAAGVLDTRSVVPGPLADMAASPSAQAVPASAALTPLERLTVATVVQRAATQQSGQSQLFANLDVAATGGLPPRLQQAVMQVLAQRTSLDQNLTGAAINTAFRKSGLLMEASLASESPAAGIPDLKAALLVLRQTLLSSLGTAAPAAQKPAASAEDAATAPPLAPSISPESDALAPKVPLAAAAGAMLGSVDGLRTATAGTDSDVLKQALPNGAKALSMPTPSDLRGTDVTLHPDTPPPFRGAQPSAQPVALPSMAPEAPLASTARHLLADTDAAIARQTLLQVASLPDRGDAPGLRIDPSAPRWNFEIPFVTAQGTAMAQFEISSDRGGQETGAAGRVWRARFSLDVEPAGPVHALVSLAGDTTSVRMWAERAATAQQLRAGAAQLTDALARAELTPGDIVIRDGAPPPSQPAPAGHFLDRAL